MEWDGMGWEALSLNDMVRINHPHYADDALGMLFIYVCEKFA